MFPSSSTHYISINNIISSYINPQYTLSFDLYRIKFDIKLNKIFNENKDENVQMYIPSEFLDISIPKFYDEGLQSLRHKLYNEDGSMIYFAKLDNNVTECYNVLTINLKYTIKDLNNVLYNQNNFPWNDAKYDKRIIRSLFLIFIVYYKNAVKNDCVDLVDSTLDIFINKLSVLSGNILTWFTDTTNPDNKTAVLNSINSLIFLNDQNNNLLNVRTLANFYDYQNKEFFKIKYYDPAIPENEILSHVFHGELDMAINIITKIIFMAVEDIEIYKMYVNMCLQMDNYVFNTPQDKEEYVNQTFLKEYVEFIDKFVKNIIFMKKLIFDNLKTNSNIPTNDLLLKGGSRYHKKNVITTNGKHLQFSNSKFTDVPFKTMKNIKSNNKTKLQPRGDLEDLEMIN
jgi:hypothetical protein